MNILLNAWEEEKDFFFKLPLNGVDRKQEKTEIEKSYIIQPNWKVVSRQFI